MISHKLFGLALWPVNDLIDRINGYERIFIRFQNVGHQRCILIFIDNGDDLLPGLSVIGADGFIDGCAAVEVVQDKISDFLLALGDDAHTFFDIEAKDEVIQGDSVQIRAQDAEHHYFFIVDESRGQGHAHAS